MNSLTSKTDRILARWPDVVASPPERDRDMLVAIMRQRLERNEWQDTRLSLVTSAARALFDDQRRHKADLAELRSFYFDEIRASTRQGFLGVMFSIYLASFEAEADHTRALAASLAASQQRLGARWRKLAINITDIFTPKTVALSIARKMKDMDNPWVGLQQIGIRSPHAPGLMNEAHLAFVKLIEPELKKRTEMERLLGWLKPDKQEAKIAGAGEAISALLGHWTSKSPGADDIRYLTENLVGVYGDPRVQRGGVWSAVPEERMAVIMRWLTGENIRFFLDVVSAVEDSHMWEPRRKFWLGLHNQGRIDAAWVAFSDRGQMEAKRRGNTASTRGTLRFGRQVAGGGRSNTSLLVLKIGRKIVVEGSHSYKVYIFDISNQKAPALYQPRYDCEEIRQVLGSKSRSHVGDWQSWVLENI